jgi:predicted acetyltransferase
MLAVTPAWSKYLTKRTGSLRHIGYAIVPEFRRRGFATEILRQAVGIARDKLEIKRILVTCDDDNIGSIRTIEKNGGVLENVVSGPDLSIPKRRYWIDAGRSDGS